VFFSGQPFSETEPSKEEQTSLPYTPSPLAWLTEDKVRSQWLPAGKGWP
jgi:hypothetical protein